MEIPLQLPSTIYGWFAIFAFIISTLLFLRRNDINSIKEANDELRKRLNDKDDVIKDLQIQINTLSGRIAKLTGILEEKDKRIDALSKVQIVQQSNPDVLQYMSDMRIFATQAHQYMLDSSKVLAELNMKGGKQ